MIDIKNLTIEKAHDALLKGECTCTELAEAYLKAIAEKNTELNAYLEIYDDVLEQAEAAQAKFRNGTATLLTGIPVALKDNILVKGKIASGGSKILANYKATYDATAVAKLKKEGAVFLGRTNMDEFALGSSTENSAYGVTHNPYDVTRVSGGTSGGVVAAVAAHLALVGLGSDTGGSVRQPSSFCGVVGFKPTYGGVSRHGLMAAASSFDVIGPVARNVRDAEILFDTIKGHDAFDSTSVDLEKVQPTTSKKVIGVPWDLIDQKGIDPVVQENFKNSVEVFKKAGYDIKTITLPNTLSVYYIINFAEVSSNLSRFDGMRYGVRVEGTNLLEDYLQSKGKGFGKESRRRILLGAYVLSAGYYDAYYGKAQKAQKALKKTFAHIFKDVDFILTPTAPTPAWKIGEKSDPLSMYLEDIFTVTANIVGVPAMSLPSGFMEVEGKKLPLGVQAMAAHGREKELFGLGKEFESLNA